MIETECERTVEKELRILKKCNHPNIVRCYGFFHNETNIYYILEYCPNGNLYTAIETNPLDEVTAATVCLCFNSFNQNSNLNIRKKFKIQSTSIRSQKRSSTFTPTK